MSSQSPPIRIRPAVFADGSAVMTFLKETGFFRPCELDIAHEVFCEAAENKTGCTYQSYVAQVGGKPVGWICFGPTPCTEGTFDIYWIGVEPGCQRLNIGTFLMDFAGKEITRRKGRLMVIETSGSARYTPTQNFYLKNGFSLVSRVPDFYAPGDDKLVFTRALQS